MASKKKPPAKKQKEGNVIPKYLNLIEINSDIIDPVDKIELDDSIIFATPKKRTKDDDMSSYPLRFIYLNFSIVRTWRILLTNNAIIC
jgi:hypothetical protein